MSELVAAGFKRPDALVDACHWLRQQVAADSGGTVYTEDRLADWGISRAERRLLRVASAQPLPWTAEPPVAALEKEAVQRASPTPKEKKKKKKKKKQEQMVAAAVAAAAPPAPLAPPPPVTPAKNETHCPAKLRSTGKLKSMDPTPSRGDVVMAKFSEDGCWYEAEITAVQPNGNCLTQYCVTFTEYGNSELVLETDIYPRDTAEQQGPAAELSSKAVGQPRSAPPLCPRSVLLRPPSSCAVRCELCHVSPRLQSV